MNRFNFSVIGLLFATAVFLGCNKDKPESTEQIAVHLTANISAPSLKVADDQWQATDKVGLYMKRTGQAITATGAVYGGAANVQMSLSEQTLIADSPVYYPLEGNVDFVAYYPYTAPVGADCTIPVNLEGQDTEILYSNNITNQAPIETAVKINFRYSLAKIELTVTGGANSKLTATDFADMTASVDGMYTKAKLQLTDGTFSDRQAKQPITLRKTGNNATSASFEALALPTNEEVTFLFNVRGAVHSYKTTANYAAATLYKFGFALDFPAFPEPKATLLNAFIIPRTLTPQQNFSVDATLQMTMTTEAEKVTLQMDGNGMMIIDWGDGTPEDAYMISGLTTYTHGYSSASAHTITIIGENITELWCRDNNQLTSLDVSKNTALTSLICSANQLTELDVSKNAALTLLRCNGNQLTSMDVSKNTALTQLICGTNPLTNLDVSKNKALTILGCWKNQLSNLDVSKNTALIHLECDVNQLTNLDVSKNTALTYFDCGVNQLINLDVSKNTALTEFHCYDNLLTSLDVSKNTALTYLDCKNNQLTSLDVSKNTVLTYLLCWGNQFTAAGLNTLFGTLHNNTVPPQYEGFIPKLLYIGNNPGTGSCNTSIAESKGWTVDKN